MGQLDGFGWTLEGWSQLHMARADLFDRLERKRQAADAYRLALELDAPETGPVFIARRLRQLAAT